MTTENLPQMTREQLESMPLSPELSNRRQVLLFKTEAVWLNFQNETDSLWSEWQEFAAAVQRFQQQNGSVQ